MDYSSSVALMALKSSRVMMLIMILRLGEVVYVPRLGTVGALHSVTRCVTSALHIFDDVCL